MYTTMFASLSTSNQLDNGWLAPETPQFFNSRLRPIDTELSFSPHPSQSGRDIEYSTFLSSPTLFSSASHSPSYYNTLARHDRQMSAGPLDNHQLLSSCLPEFNTFHQENESHELALDIDHFLTTVGAHVTEDDFIPGARCSMLRQLSAFPLPVEALLKSVTACADSLSNSPPLSSPESSSTSLGTPCQNPESLPVLPFKSLGDVGMDSSATTTLLGAEPGTENSSNPPPPRQLSEPSDAPTQADNTLPQELAHHPYRKLFADVDRARSRTPPSPTREIISLDVEHDVVERVSYPELPRSSSPNLINPRSSLSRSASPSEMTVEIHTPFVTMDASPNDPDFLLPDIIPPDPAGAAKMRRRTSPKEAGSSRAPPILGFKRRQSSTSLRSSGSSETGKKAKTTLTKRKLRTRGSSAGSSESRVSASSAGRFPVKRESSNPPSSDGMEIDGFRIPRVKIEQDDDLSLTGMTPRAPSPSVAAATSPIMAIRRLRLPASSSRAGSAATSRSTSRSTSAASLTASTSAVRHHPVPPARHLSSSSVVYNTGRPSKACTFCRRRKIACAPCASPSSEDACQQCVERKLQCEYPAEVQAAAEHVPVRARFLDKGAKGERKSTRPPVPKREPSI